mmetsp:Transcript_8220/g.33212  ORF Transcript_8220/g.33212 Transcript_8220/m.33212 type:complete len:225 (+) Transcript_8220:479-1153(+)
MGRRRRRERRRRRRRRRRVPRRRRRAVSPLRRHGAPDDCGDVRALGGREPRDRAALEPDRPEAGASIDDERVLVIFWSIQPKELLEESKRRRRPSRRRRHRLGRGPRAQRRGRDRIDAQTPRVARPAAAGGDRRRRGLQRRHRVHRRVARRRGRLLGRRRPGPIAADERGRASSEGRRPHLSPRGHPAPHGRRERGAATVVRREEDRANRARRVRVPHHRPGSR